MSLRNKIAILSVTLMSLMTIPTLAENGNAPVTSRIENDHFDVEVKIPEGWSETKDFVSIPETYSLGGQVYKGVQFGTGLENHGCVVFFAEKLSDDGDNDDSFLGFLTQAHEFAFPGSKPSIVVSSKGNLDGSFAWNTEKGMAKADVKGTIYATLSDENGETTPLTATGKLHADSTKGNFIVGSGTILKEETMPITGTTAILSVDDYAVIIALWGSDEKAQVKDAYRFAEALGVKKKAPANVEKEPVVSAEPISEKGSEAVAASDPTAEKGSTTTVLAESSVAEKTESPSTEVST